MENVVEYIWIGGHGEIRSKTRVIYKPFFTYHDIPEWNYDGSSTGQADSNKNTEVILKPCRLFKNPLLSKRNSFLVLCDTYDTDFNPLPTNHRHNAMKIFDSNIILEPWFGLEQEYFMVCDKNKQHTDLTSPFNDHYCGTQTSNIERIIVEKHLLACLEIGIQISGLNAEVSPRQWEFQIGPCVGIDAGDHMIIARYLLDRIAEKCNVFISYYPKLVEDLNGSGCHTNFSTSVTRSENGIEEIYKYIEKLNNKHLQHIEVYGDGNHYRLTGLHETSRMDTFTYGIGTRNTSVRIPNQVIKDGCGYFEDRRPAANIDPYQVTSIMFKTCCLDDNS
jgi:glutamine synthetase